MIIQIIKYNSQKLILDTVEEIKYLYSKNGCISFEVFRDAKDNNSYIEIARFDNMEVLRKFENMQNEDKKAIYDKFCKLNDVKNVEVSVIESIM